MLMHKHCLLPENSATRWIFINLGDFSFYWSAIATNKPPTSVNEISRIYTIILCGVFLEIKQNYGLWVMFLSFSKLWLFSAIDSVAKSFFGHTQKSVFHWNQRPSMQPRDASLKTTKFRASFSPKLEGHLFWFNLTSYFFWVDCIVACLTIDAKLQVLNITSGLVCLATHSICAISDLSCSFSVSLGGYPSTWHVLLSLEGVVDYLCNCAGVPELHHPR